MCFMLFSLVFSEYSLDVACHPLHHAMLLNFSCQSLLYIYTELCIYAESYVYIQIWFCFVCMVQKYVCGSYL